MIIVRVTSGLGNQMFHYAIGRSLSLLSATPLWLDLDWFETNTVDTKRDYGLGHFNIAAKPLTKPFLTCYNQLSRRRFAPLRPLIRSLGLPLPPRRIVDLHNGFDERPRSYGSNLYLEGDWQTEIYFKDIRQILLEDFTFKEHPDAENSLMLQTISGSNAVCVHVRRGDYATESGQKRFGLCDLDYYRRAIELIRKRVSDAQFFVFSDDPDWVISNFPIATDMIAVTHNAGKKDWEDFRLMMNCNHFVIANSTFSWWAAWLGRHDKKIVIAPSRWLVQSGLVGDDVVPANWVRL